MVLTRNIESPLWNPPSPLTVLVELPVYVWKLLSSNVISEVELFNSNPNSQLILV